MYKFRTQQCIDVSLGLLFTLCAWVQLNDPDPILWFGLYLSIAGLTVGLVFSNTEKKVISLLKWGRWALLSFTLFWTVWHWPWSEEEWREVGGGALLTLWLWWRYAQAMQTSASEP